HVDADHRGRDRLDRAHDGGGVGVERLGLELRGLSKRVSVEHSRRHGDLGRQTQGVRLRLICENRPGMISLSQTAILLAAAVVAVSLFRFARLSSILGYLAAGLVIGPWGLNLLGAASEGQISRVSEFGIVLLLFIIGLELQPTRLWVMRKIVFGLGAVQVIVCALLLGGVAFALGQK